MEIKNIKKVYSLIVKYFDPDWNVYLLQNLKEYFVNCVLLLYLSLLAPLLVDILLLNHIHKQVFFVLLFLVLYLLFHFPKMINFIFNLHVFVKSLWIFKHQWKWYLLVILNFLILEFCLYLFTFLLFYLLLFV